jgi:hypothetical protein
MKTKLFISLFMVSSLFATSTIKANTVKGVIVNEKNQPVEYAIATLVNPSTNEIISGEVCNAKGEFSISQVTPGEYILAVKIPGNELDKADTVIVANKTSVVEKKVVVKASDLNTTITAQR